MTEQTVHFHLGEVAAATHLVRTHHYSGLMPPSLSLVGTWHEQGGLFGDSGEAVAACVYRQPSARWAEPVMELARLVRVPGCDAPLSSLVATTTKWVKRKGLADLVVSLADSTHNHHGGIYQACSWNYDGQRSPRMDGVIVDGRYYAGRAANHHWGTQSPDKLRAIGIAAEPHFDTGKHVYWRALTKTGRRQAEALGLRSCAYPKPDTLAMAS